MKKLYKITIIAFLLMAVGCSPKMYTTQYKKEPQVRLATNVSESQTIGNITIDLSPLQLDEEYKQSFYQQKIPVTYTPRLSTTPVTAPKEFNIQFFKNLTPFHVTVVNNTDHIIRMRDSRVVYIDPNSDEPIFAYDKDAVISDPKYRIPAYDILLNDLRRKYYRTDPSKLEMDVRNAIVNIGNRIRYINGFNMEILPSMRTTGTLLFPINPEKISEGKISFIDMISKTDPAGNPIERVRFDYKTDIFYQYYKHDPNLKNWVEIDDREYSSGINSPEKFNWDKTQKRWISNK